jgi:hypothetical protein
MPDETGQSWDSASLDERSRAWYVTKLNGRCAGAPSCEILLVIQIPQPCCIIAKLFPISAKGWEHIALRALVTDSPPTILITDDKKLMHTLVSVGSSLERPATPYLDKPIALMPAIDQCVRSMVSILNGEPFTTGASIDRLNEAFEIWRLDYNRRQEHGPTWSR